MFKNHVKLRTITLNQCAGLVTLDVRNKGWPMANYQLGICMVCVESDISSICGW